MGSKSCIPPLHLQRPLPGPGFLQPDPFGLGILPPPGVFPFDKLPPPEIMEQKLAAQHVEMQRLALENEIMEQKLAAQHVEMQRLALENESFAATHYSSRKELSAAQQELQRLQTDMGAIRADQEQQVRMLLDNISKMDSDLKASEPVNVDMQQARPEAQSLVAARQELISRVQQLTEDLQRSHGNVQQIPSLMLELAALRQEYQDFRS